MRTPLRLLALLSALLFAGGTLAQTLDFWSWRVEDVDAYNEIIDVFEAENPGITVNFQAFEASSYNTVLSSALSADEGPDIIHVRAYGGFETFAAPGFLRPLGGEVEALESFPPLAVQGQTLRSDGLVYAVPFATQTLVIYYNTAIFDEAGVDVPTTWDEFIAAAEALQGAGYVPMANGTATGWMDEVLFGAFAPSIYGADFFDEVVTGETTFEDPRFIAALERVNSLTPYLAPDHVGVDYPAAQALFLNEVAAMFVGGSWEIANFRNQNPDLEFALMAPPALEEGGGVQRVASFLDGGYAVNAGTEHEEAALRFIEFLASQEFGQMLTDKLANLSPIPGVQPTDPLLQQITEFNRNASPYIMLVGFRYENPTGSTLIQEGLQRMFAGDATPEEVAAAVQEGIATYYEPFRDD